MFHDLVVAFQLLADVSDDIFQFNNRMGVSGTLHRISALKNRYGKVCGLTYRIGRHVPGEIKTLCIAFFV